MKFSNNSNFPFYSTKKIFSSLPSFSGVGIFLVFYELFDENNGNSCPGINSIKAFFCNLVVIFPGYFRK